MAFAPWEDIIKYYNVLSPMGVFVLGGIYMYVALTTAPIFLLCALSGVYTRVLTRVLDTSGHELSSNPPMDMVFGVPTGGESGLNPG